MSEVLEKHSFRRGPAPAKQDWTLWGDGRIHKLTKGVDFDCKPSAFDKRARRHALKIGAKVRVSSDDETIVVQFYKATKNA